MIRRANASDIEGIMRTVEAAKDDMHSYGNYQWDKNYPKAEHFSKDMEEGSLFVYERVRDILGFICVNKEEPAEYGDMNWSSGEEALTIHRLAVDKSLDSRGVAKELMEYAEEVCRKKGISYIKTDTNKLNMKAQGLLGKCGYTFIGETGLYEHEGRFYCYDKRLTLDGLSRMQG